MNRSVSLAAFTLFVLLTGGCERTAEVPPETVPTSAGNLADAEFVGVAVCAGCHEYATARWHGSHHDLAMQPAGASTVLGDFDNAVIEYAGIRSVFTQRDGQFLVRTDGPDGELADFPIAYTFGVEPLQQYLIEFPDGRLQALSLAWDTRPADLGGQRWFHLYPDQRIDYADELHWTRPSQNWNYMCADCHSTGYRKNYDVTADRFDSSWTDVDVACEACHGPGSRHVTLAEAETLEDDTGLVVSTRDPQRQWIRRPGVATAQLQGATNGRVQVEACGQCHARRASIRTEYAHGAPLTDSFVPALLVEPLYYPDGQIRDEVYVYGSFLQSRMHAASVVCTDCHDPHSLKPRATGDALCAQCHAPEVFAVPGHHHHEMEDGTPQCVDCHMPSRDYMVVDGRRDHSFRVPRPDLATRLGVTDACDTCHADRHDDWSAMAVRDWLGRDAAGFQQFGETFRAAETGRVEAAAELRTLALDQSQPGVVRATALAYLASYPDPTSLRLAADALADPDAIVRLGALNALDPLPAEIKTEALLHLLDDPVRSVRTEAARQLAGLDPGVVDAAHRQRLQAAIAEYIEIQRGNADRPEAWLNLGLLYARAGQPDTAEKYLRSAIRLNAGFEPAYVNMADLLRARGDEAGAEANLREGLKAVPDGSALHHAMGLLKVRTAGTDTALPWLERAARLAPEQTRYQYVLAVALHDVGRRNEAIAILDKAHRDRPADLEVLYALISYQRDAGNRTAALQYATALLEIRPDDPQVQALVNDLIPP